MLQSSPLDDRRHVCTGVVYRRHRVCRFCFKIYHSDLNYLEFQFVIVVGELREKWYIWTIFDFDHFRLKWHAYTTDKVT